ncbi:hypothetical protein, variant [Capsaspora owczarzaki ATCC 30864]|uniref:EGF-like domain-containing protein n=1 Tax=Capsaspora owczarzaki (strain ATCC 30864) TaxID=595528 RepID=A0A0D2X1P8_CAPO3|nr:hypothetical protein, variant [Capsaspora owczarzaki ATCC 30864]
MRSPITVAVVALALLAVASPWTMTGVEAVRGLPKSSNVLRNAGRSGPSQTLDRCDACRKAVREISTRMTDTAGKNFGGGNTAWEQSRFSAWATSEVRLVEVMDSICSDKMEFSCRQFLDDHEEHVEKWFYHHQSEPMDRWLCSETSRVCCEHGHVGPQCKPCPGGPTNICNGKGECKGMGSVDGSGECKCRDPYKGRDCTQCKPGHFRRVLNDNPDQPRVECVKCDPSCKACTGEGRQACKSCAQGFYNTTEAGCMECDPACQSCTDAGPSSCIACSEGYAKDPVNCADVDECATKAHSCRTDQICVNTPGSFHCDCPTGEQDLNDACVPTIQPEADASDFDVSELSVDDDDAAEAQPEVAPHSEL